MWWRELKPLQIFIGSCAATAIALLIAVIPFLQLDPGFSAYAGSVAGGIVGGAMTVYAGYMAWSAAVGQIEGQQNQLKIMQRQLDLAGDEHRRRLIAVLSKVIESLEVPSTQLAIAQMQIEQLIESRDVDVGEPTLSVSVHLSWPDYPIDDGEIWRLPIKLSKDMRKLRAAIGRCNEWRGVIVSSIDLAIRRNKQYDDAVSLLWRIKLQASRQLKELETQDLTPPASTHPTAPPAP